MKFFYLVPFAVILLLFGCYEQHPNTEAVKEEMKENELVRISQGEIFSQASMLGDSMIKKFEARLHEAGFDTDSAKLILPAVNKTLRETSSGEDFSVKLLDDDRYASDIDKEAELVEAMFYDPSVIDPSTRNIQYYNDKRGVLYNAPYFRDGKIIGVWSLRFTTKLLVKMINKHKQKGSKSGY